MHRRRADHSGDRVGAPGLAPLVDAHPWRARARIAGVVPVLRAPALGDRHKRLADRLRTLRTRPIRSGSSSRGVDRSERGPGRKESERAHGDPKPNPERPRMTGGGVGGGRPRGRGPPAPRRRPRKTVARMGSSLCLSVVLRSTATAPPATPTSSRVRPSRASRSPPATPTLIGGNKEALGVSLLLAAIGLFRGRRRYDY